MKNRANETTVTISPALSTEKPAVTCSLRDFLLYFVRLGTFGFGGPIALAARMEKANVDVKIDQHLLRLSPSVYNNQADIDRLLNALS